MKKIFTFLIIVYSLFVLSGCVLFDKEYVSINEYNFPTQNTDAVDPSSFAVHNLSELKSSILSIVDSGAEDGQIVVSENYAGDIDEDVANAIWQVKSQDALCAYCVKNMTYDLTTIVTYTEVNLHVSYSKLGIQLNQIHKLQYSTDLKEIIETSIYNSERKLVILVDKSSYSSSDMEKLICSTYRENPLICPVEPIPSVKLFSGNNSQRLYEIEFNYVIDNEILNTRKEALNNITLFTEEEMKLSDFEKAETVISRLNQTTIGNGNTVFDALILNSANSEGYSLGFVALCREIGLEAVAVYGQQNLEDCSWNIVKIDENYYHVLPPFMVYDGLNNSYRTDEQMWGIYRWNTGDYPKCDKPLVID